MGRILASILFVFTVFCGPLSAAAPEIEQANQLITEGKYIEAFELLEPLEFDLSGDEAFDLLFGFTALEAGHISLATLALERVLAVNPDNNTARFHLARGYFVLNDFNGARREFEMLLSMNPTAGVRETVGQYLDAIAAREPGAKSVWSGYVAFGLGSDTNVTGGTSNNPIFYPGVDQSIELPDSDVEDEDNYANLTAGLDFVHRFSDANSVYAGGDLNNRVHDDRSDLDYILTSLRGGYQRAFGNQAIRAGLGLGYMKLDDDPYRESDTIELEWRNTPAQRSQVGVVLTQSRYRHRDRLDEVSDYDDTRLNLSYLRVVGEEGDKLVSTAIDFGREDEINDRADGDADYVELSVTGQMQFSDRSSGFLLLSYLEIDYQRENSLFAEKRNESQTSLVGGLVFEFAHSLSVRATAVISDTSSNFSVNDTSREDISVTLRKDFY